MFKPNNIRAAILALLLPVTALAGITSPADDSGPVRPVLGEKAAKPTGSYQLRCWQEGRLLFEENHIALPASDGSPYRIRMAATDSKGAPMYIAETSNATCLIRNVGPKKD